MVGGGNYVGMVLQISNRVVVIDFRGPKVEYRVRVVEKICFKYRVVSEFFDPSNFFPSNFEYPSIFYTLSQKSFVAPTYKKVLSPGT